MFFECCCSRRAVVLQINDEKQNLKVLFVTLSLSINAEHQPLKYHYWTHIQKKKWTKHTSKENRNNIEDRKENTKLRFQSTSKMINRSSVSNTSKNITCNNISYKNKGINTVKKKVKFKANLCEIVEIESFKSYLLNNQSNEREKINCRCMIF